MATPTGPLSPSSYNSSASSEESALPSTFAMPANSPWVKSLQNLFPNVPVGELQLYAQKFEQNMFSALNSEIQRDLKKAREMARKFKESIEE